MEAIEHRGGSEDTITCRLLDGVLECGPGGTVTFTGDDGEVIDVAGKISPWHAAFLRIVARNHPNTTPIADALRELRCPPQQFYLRLSDLRLRVGHIIKTHGSHPASTPARHVRLNDWWWTRPL